MQNVQLVVVLLPDKDADLCLLVKRIGDQHVDIHTICHIMGENKYKNDPNDRDFILYSGPKFDNGFLANLFMKANLKLDVRAANHVLQQKGPIFDENTMIMGMDVVSILQLFIFRC